MVDKTLHSDVEKMPVPIRVNNFDSYLQANLWRGMGAEKACKHMTAALRLALLLGDTVLLDRNEVLDGIYFLTMGPERIAAELGLDSSEKLPFTWMWQPGRIKHGSISEVQSAENQDLTSLVDPDWIPPNTKYVFDKGNAGETSSLFPEEKRVSISTQEAGLNREDFWKFSSSLAGIWDSVASQVESGTTWVYVPPNQNVWYPGAGLTDRFHPISSEEEARQLIQKARQKWYEWAIHDRIKVQPWKQIKLENREKAFAAHYGEICKLTGEENLDSLAREVAHITSSSRRVEVPEQIAAIADEDAVYKPIPGAESLANNRDRRNRLAFQFWSRLYNFANASLNNAMFLSLSFPNPEVHGRGDELNLISFGLRTPAPKRQRGIMWEYISSKFARTTSKNKADERANSKTLWQVNGELLDDILYISPAAYKELLQDLKEKISNDLNSGKRGALFNLAISARNQVHKAENYAQKFKSTFARATLISLIVVLITGLSLLNEVVHFSGPVGFAIVLVVAFLSFISSLPWGDIKTVAEMRPSQMSATLSMR